MTEEITREGKRYLALSRVRIIEEGKSIPDEWLENFKDFNWFLGIIDSKGNYRYKKQVKPDFNYFDNIKYMRTFEGRVLDIGYSYILGEGHTWYCSPSVILSFEEWHSLGRPRNLSEKVTESYKPVEPRTRREWARAIKKEKMPFR